MKRSQKLALALTSLGALLATGIGAIPTTHASNSAIDALRAQRAVLVAELAAMAPSVHLAGTAVSGAENAYQSQQLQVLQNQQQLAKLNAELQSLNQQLLSDNATIANDKAQLATVIRATFETTTNDQVLAAILSANTFGQAMDRLRNANQVSQQVIDLITHVSAQEAEVHADQAKVKADFAKATQLEGTLGNESSQLLATLLTRNEVFAQLNGPARALATQIGNIDEQIAAMEAPPAPPAVHAGGSCGDHFSFGQCTWYVASRRCIPWDGNADQWYYRAQQYGFRVGHTPAPGAVVVFWPGGDGASSIGHVGYVEAVGPADGIPAGYFRLSEMNATAGWDRVDYRTLPNNSGGIQGFIY